VFDNLAKIILSISLIVTKSHVIVSFCRNVFIDFIWAYNISIILAYALNEIYELYAQEKWFPNKISPWV
jgi:hypothetical protein